MNDSRTIIIDRLLMKGKGIVETCMTHGSTVCARGFVRHQIAKGEEYIPVVEALGAYVECEILRAQDDPVRSDLLQRIADDIAEALLEERLPLLLHGA